MNTFRCSRPIGILAAAATVMLAVPALAQSEDRRSPPPRETPSDAPDDTVEPPADREDPWRAIDPRDYRDRPPPSRPRTYGPRRRPSWGQTDQFDLRHQFYRYDHGYRFGVPAFDQFELELERAYNQGVEDGRRLERMEMQAQRVLSAYEQALETGRWAFAEARYGFAARQLLLAASLDQSDAVSRLAAGQAHIALGDYEAAAELIRRALELQPKIIYLPFDARGLYERIEEFEKHVASLERAVVESPDDADRWFLLGYCLYFSESMARAADAFQKAADLSPGDTMIAELANLSRLSAKETGPDE